MRACIVTGDRYARWTDWYPTVRDKLIQFHGGDDSPLTVIHGAADGIDAMADDIALANRYRYIRIPVPVTRQQWIEQGRPAGPIRNGHMLDILKIYRERGYLCRVLAFHDDIKASKGTKNMVNLATAAEFATDITPHGWRKDQDKDL